MTEELRSHFLVLQIFGIWTPNLKSVTYHCLYHLWRVIIILHMLTFFISEIIDLCLQENVEGITRNSVISTVMFCGILKVSTLLLKRKEITETLNLLKLPICLPKTIDEYKILQEYRRHAWSVAAGFLILCYLTLFMQLGVPLVYKNGIKERSLPYYTWQPYSIEPTVPYVLTYLHLALCTLVTMPLCITADNLISGFMIVICGHLEILKFRLARLQTADDIKICVQHHNIILQCTERVEKIFGSVVFVQFLISTINICLIIFIIYAPESKAGSIASMFFLACMMIQLLLYCWNGNEVFFKSQSVTGASMENTNWLTLPLHVKKALLLIMIRSQKPVQMRAGGLLTLSLETFTMIVTTSYKAFNLLQSASNIRN